MKLILLRLVSPSENELSKFYSQTVETGNLREKVMQAVLNALT